MAAKTLPDIKIGNSLLRVQQLDKGFKGCVITGSTRSDVLDDDDLESLMRRLRQLVGQQHPNYFGYDGAIGRFLQFFPRGFSDARYVEKEREFKMKLGARLAATLPLADAETATGAALAEFSRAISANLLAVQEAARLRETFASADGVAFIRGAAQFTAGDFGKGLKAMAGALSAHGRGSWPIVTLLPFLWAPDRHFFIKPVATVDFAQRVGHDFAYRYSAELTPDVYAAALELVTDVARNISQLEPRDSIDVQSFIWVVGSYTDADLP